MLCNFDTPAMHHFAKKHVIWKMNFFNLRKNKLSW